MGVNHPGLPGLGMTQEQQQAAVQLANDVQAMQANPDKPLAPTPTVEPQASPVFGKYRSMEDAEKGYWELVNTLKAREDALRDATTRMSAYEQQAMRQTNFAQPQRSPYDGLAEIGVDPALVKNAVQSEVQAGIQAALAPLMEGMRAKQVVSQQFPDYPAKENEVASFLNSNPELQQRFNRMFNTDPTSATEWAYLRYQQHTGSQPRQPVAQPSMTVADAALPGASGGQRANPIDDRMERMAKAKQYYDIYKDEMPLVHERLRDMIPDSHFDIGS